MFHADSKPPLIALVEGDLDVNWFRKSHFPSTFPFTERYYHPIEKTLKRVCNNSQLYKYLHD